MKELKPLKEMKIGEWFRTKEGNILQYKQMHRRGNYVYIGTWKRMEGFFNKKHLLDSIVAHADKPELLLQFGDYLNGQKICMTRCDNYGILHFYSSFWYSSEIMRPFVSFATQEKVESVTTVLGEDI